MSSNPRILYGALAILVFITEVAIATGRIPGQFIRGSVGDILAVLLIVLALRALTTCSSCLAAALAVACGFIVEGLQYLHADQWLGFAKGSIGAIVLGSTFSVSDLLMYSIGGVLSLVLDRYLVGYLKSR